MMTGDCTSSYGRTTWRVITPCLAAWDLHPCLLPCLKARRKVEVANDFIIICVCLFVHLRPPICKKPLQRRRRNRFLRRNRTIFWGFNALTLYFNYRKLNSLFVHIQKNSFSVFTPYPVLDYNLYY